MTRKDYKTIARVIHATRDMMDYNALAFLIGTMSNELKDENPRFDHDRFWDACMDGYKRRGTQ